MRAVGLSDLDLATRAVMAVPQDAQAQFAQELLCDAHACDLWRKQSGGAHPSGGTGSLFAQATLFPTVQVNGADKAYCAAFMVVLQALNAWRTRDHKVL